MRPTSLTAILFTLLGAVVGLAAPAPPPHGPPPYLTPELLANRRWSVSTENGLQGTWDFCLDPDGKSGSYTQIWGGRVYEGVWWYDSAMHWFYLKEHSVYSDICYDIGPLEFTPTLDWPDDGSFESGTYTLSWPTRLHR